MKVVNNNVAFNEERDLDLYFLDLALALADKGEGQVKPNPLVGAVIVKDGVIVGQGFHRYEGVKHAEVLALEQVGRLATLREAGIAVTVGPRTSAARILNAEYIRLVITSNASPALSLIQLLF